ncbi:hypothetical protein BDA96_04G064300 [Sorghum bicolor]|nr:hypothetical protein BDA96_04G064300 [Sorghum bicolor]
MEEVSDVADLAAMSGRSSNEGWPKASKVNSVFTSPRSSEVHGVAAMHKVHAHGRKCQIQRIHDMEAPQPQRDPSPMLLIQQLRR